MSIYTIKHHDSLDAIWNILVYEDARLASDPDASDLAAGSGALLERWVEVNAGQRSAWRAAIAAQASVDANSSALDHTIAEIDAQLLWILRDRESPRRKRYFKKTCHEIVRLRLESGIEAVRSWPASLKTEPEPALRALGERLEAVIAAGAASLSHRTLAAANTSDQRIREIDRFVDDVNAARRVRYGLLIQRAEERGLPADWPAQFFKKSTQAPRREKPPEVDQAPRA
jgi:hypothetical protein